MIKQQFKDLYFSMAYLATLPIYYRYRLQPFQLEYPEGFYLHLGSGPKHIVGMINIDGNVRQKKELWLDLRHGLPFPDQSVYFIYSCHVLEHFFPDAALQLLREMHRTLKSYGIVRLAVPSMEWALQIAAGQATSVFPRSFEDSYAQAINYLFCDGQHKYGYSAALLTKFAYQAGFRSVTNYSAQHGVVPRTYGRVTVGDEPAGSLILELRRA